MTIAEAEKYCDDGQFPAGSMLPKVKARLNFVNGGGEAIIASLEKTSAAIKGESRTKTTKQFLFTEDHK